MHNNVLAALISSVPNMSFCLLTGIQQWTPLVQAALSTPSQHLEPRETLASTSLASSCTKHHVAHLD
jgi:hypothetical protein